MQAGNSRYDPLEVCRKYLGNENKAELYMPRRLPRILPNTFQVKDMEFVQSLDTAGGSYGAGLIGRGAEKMVQDGLISSSLCKAIKKEVLWRAENKDLHVVLSYVILVA